MPLPTPDTQVAQIAQRIRGVVERPAAYRLDELADSLLLDRKHFRALIEKPEAALDTNFILDVVTALAYCQGFDPHWLLTGHYDSAIHRHVLYMGEDRGLNAMRNVRDFVVAQFASLRRNTPWPPLIIADDEAALPPTPRTTDQ